MASVDQEPGLFYIARRVNDRVGEMLEELQAAFVDSGSVEIQPPPPNPNQIASSTKTEVPRQAGVNVKR